LGKYSDKNHHYCAPLNIKPLIPHWEILEKSLKENHKLTTIVV
jgi:hypothetical protein